MTASSHPQPTGPGPGERRDARRPTLRVIGADDPPRRSGGGYSRFVGLMKIVLPAVAVVLVILVMVWPQLQPKDSRFRIGFAALGSRDAESPSMLNPRYVGIDENRQPFSVTADLARNVLHKLGTVELEMPKADITLRDGTWLVLTAETGIYNRGDKRLDLVGSVNLYHDGGYEIRTARAGIDLDRGMANGDQPVEGHGPFGDLKAQGFELHDKGKVIIFKGRSRLVIHPQAGAQP